MRRSERAARQARREVPTARSEARGVDGDEGARGLRRLRVARAASPTPAHDQRDRTAQPRATPAHTRCDIAPERGLAPPTMASPTMGTASPTSRTRSARRAGRIGSRRPRAAWASSSPCCCPRSAPCADVLGRDARRCSGTRTRNLGEPRHTKSRSRARASSAP